MSEVHRQGAAPFGPAKSRDSEMRRFLLSHVHEEPRPHEEQGVDCGHDAAARPELNRLATSATNHCLTGCVIGEVTGMMTATALGWEDVASITWPLRSPSCSATA
jgi:hypothetical protein